MITAATKARLDAKVREAESALRAAVVVRDFVLLDNGHKAECPCPVCR